MFSNVTLEEQRELVQLSEQNALVNPPLFLDRVVHILLEVQLRKALQLVNQSEENNDCKRIVDKVNKESSVKFMQYPLPSLFCDVASTFVHKITCCQPTKPDKFIASHRLYEPTSTHERVMLTEEAITPPPPAYLLAHCQDDHEHNSERVDNSYYTNVKQVYTLDFTHDRRACANTFTVLEGELALAIYTKTSLQKIIEHLASQQIEVNSYDGKSKKEDRSDDDDGDNDDVFLLSVDATSCVIVCCRASLHPWWREKCERYTKTDDHIACSKMTEKDKCFLLACNSIITATMAHFNEHKNVAPRLFEMIYCSLIPGWLHLLYNVYKEIYNISDLCNVSSDTIESALCKLKALIVHLSHCEECNSQLSHSNVAPLLEKWESSESEEEEEEKWPPIIYIEWFLVGGVRSTKMSNIAVLSSVFAALFTSHNTNDGDSKCDNNNNNEKSNENYMPILSDTFQLSEGFSNCEKLRGSEQAHCVRVEHYLREDGICCWSNNSYQKHTQKKSSALTNNNNNSNNNDNNNPNSRTNKLVESEWYPCVTGLMVSLKTGMCWAVKMKEDYMWENVPCSLIRGVMNGDLHWVNPIVAYTFVDANTTDNNNKLANNIIVTNQALCVAINTLASVKAWQLIVNNECSREHYQINWVLQPNPMVPNNVTQCEQLTLYRYIDMWVSALRDRQCRRREEAGDNCSARVRVIMFPFTLRYCDVQWNVRLPWKVLTTNCLNNIPSANFFYFSTTPHCEPVYFGELVRQHMIVRCSLSPNEIKCQGYDALLVTGYVM